MGLSGTGTAAGSTAGASPALASGVAGSYNRLGEPEQNESAMFQSWVVF